VYVTARPEEAVAVKSKVIPPNVLLAIGANVRV
jgi:hypothetical protein